MSTPHDHDTINGHAWIAQHEQMVRDALRDSPYDLESASLLLDQVASALNFFPVGGQKRALTQKLVREAVERYFEALVDEIALGEQVELFGSGRIHVSREEGHGVLHASGPSVRLFEAFRNQCR